MKRNAIVARNQGSRGFSLIELLVVIAILSILIGILFPILRAAQRVSRDTQCASNMRQLATAMFGYATANKGAFPPNSGETKMFWYQSEEIGPYIGTNMKLADGTIARGVFLCPNDLPDSLRSYSMNFFASSYVNSQAQDLLARRPVERGVLFRQHTKGASELMLLIESWCEMPQPESPAKREGYAAMAHVGFHGVTPGKKFGAGTGIVWTDPPGATPGRFEPRATQIDFHRHRRTPGKSIYDPHGQANFAFADGHVEMLKQEELADLKTGVSRFRAMWSPADRELEPTP